MSKKFCPKCGNKTEKFYKNVCADCFLKTLDVEIPKKIILRKCKNCEKYYVGDEDFESVGEVVGKILSNSFKDEKLKSANYRISDNKIIITLNIGIEDIEKEKVGEIELVEKNIICKYCSLKNSKYFNSMLQIRVKKDLQEEILNQIKDQIYRLNRTDKFAFISGVEKLKEGYNVYVGSKSAASKVAEHLKRQYNLKTKISRKQYGMEGGKTIYRDTILLSSD